MKICTRCNEEKSLDAFHKKKEGHRSICKACRSRQDKAKYDPDKNANEILQRKFGITLRDYDLMLEEQGGCCLICNTDTPKGRGRFHVDHNHETGEIRGLLCHGCNTALGLLKDSPSILQKARDYLIEKGNYE